MPDDEAFYAAAQRRIEYFTIAIGAASAIAAGIIWGVRAGSGVGCGAVLSWINQRWLEQGVGTLTRLAKAQAGSDKVRVPKRTYLKLVGRYALLIVSAYAILRGFNLPVASLLAGLFASIAAVLVEMTGQLFRSGPHPRANS